MMVRHLLVAALFVLCARCSTGADCTQGQQCVVAAGNQACLPTCVPDAGDCPAGSTCTERQACCDLSESCPQVLTSVCCPSTGC